MSFRRFALVMIPILLAGCAGERSDEGTTFQLGLPHIPFPHIGTPQFLKDPAGSYRGELQKAVYAGRASQLWGDVSLTRDCEIAGETKLEVVAEPAHGVAVIKPGRMYAVYPEGDPHAACSGRLVDGMLAIYTPERGYTGVDQAVLRGTNANGDVRLVTVDITVAPAPPRPISARRPAVKPPATPPAEAPVTPTYRPRPIDPDAPAPTVIQSPYPGG
jgi:hypothetical protein